MKAILIVVVIVLALTGIAGIIYYVMHHEASVEIKETSLLPRESIQTERAAEFTPLTQDDSDCLFLLEDQSLLGLTGGAFRPQFEPLSSSEQHVLKLSEEQDPALQNMAGGDLDDPAGHSGLTWGGVLLGVILLAIIF